MLRLAPPRSVSGTPATTIADTAGSLRGADGRVTGAASAALVRREIRSPIEITSQIADVLALAHAVT
jgi:hypothetical protein